MKTYGSFSIGELEMIMPWERDVYVTLLINYIKEENERLKLLKQNAKHM